MTLSSNAKMAVLIDCLTVPQIKGICAAINLYGDRGPVASPANLAYFTVEHAVNCVIAAMVSRDLELTDVGEKAMVA